MTTNVPGPTFSSNGFTVPSDAAILAGVQADYNAAFGGNLNPSLSTPQGQLASSLSAVISNANQIFLYYTQQVDPAFASGRMQDAIGRIYFLTRHPALPTIVSATCTGAQGTVIPTGAQAIASDGNLYTCTTGGTIPIGGSITLTFACNAVGPIACPANSLTTIYQAIAGWDSITNPSDGTLGTNTESRSAFEARRAASVAANSVGTLQAILGSVLAVSGVLSAYVTENNTASPTTIGGVTVGANSIYVCASGGTDANVAQAIWLKKGAGCNYTGNTNVTVLDTSPGYTVPYPSYTVTFQRPTSLPIVFAISIANSSMVPSNAAALIQAAIVSAFGGGDGGPRANIGSTIYASRFYPPLAALGTWVNIVSVLLGSSNTPGASFTASITGTNMTVTAVGSGALAANQFVFGAGVPDGLIIVSQTSGSAGSTGVYVLNQSATIGSEAMTSAAPTLTKIATNINQAPTTSTLDVVVTLV